jgi:RHS repeat-associated protein
VSRGIAKALEEGVADVLKPALQDAGKAVEKAVRSVAHGAEGVAQRTEATEARAASKIASVATKEEAPALSGAGREVGGRPGGEPGTPGGVGDPKLGRGGEGEGSGAGEGAGKGGTHENEGNEGAHTEGDPVDVVSGQMISSVTDVDLAGLLPLVLRRAYASRYRGGLRFGPGWSSTLDQRLEIDADGIHYAGDDAQILHYPVPARPGQAVLPDGGARWPLTWDRQSDTIRIEEPKSGRVRHFTTLGATRSGHSEVRPITALSDRNGHRVTYLCDDEGVPTEVQHSGGYRVAVDTAYTAAGFRIEGLRLLDGSAGGQGSVLVRYQYDPRGRLAGVVNSSGLPFVYEYDEQDRVTASVDRTGSRYEYQYDDAGRVVHGIGDDGYLSATFVYDTEQRVTTVTNSLGHTTRYHYDEHEHITRTVDALGNATVTEYDRYGRLVALSDPLGHTTRYTLTEHGNPTRIEQPDGTAITAAYNPAGQLTRLVGAAGTTWRYSYDEHGNLLAVTDPLDATTAYTYDERGRLTSVTDAAGNTTLVETNTAGLQTAFTDPLGAASRIERDAFGRPVALTDPHGRTTRLGWRTEGEALWRELPEGTREEWAYDGEGNQTLHRNPAGLTTRYEYAPFALRSVEIKPDGARYTFAYNTERDLVSVTSPTGLPWRYEYDPAGRIARETDFNGRTTEYGRDAAGRLTERVNGAGQRAMMTRDALGRVTERHLDDGRATVYEYDDEGRLLRAATFDATLEYAYDAAGRLVAETVNGRTTASRYDSAGRRVERTTPSGVTSAWAFDGNGNPLSLAGAAGSLTFQYDTVGQETTRFLGSRAALTQTFDAGYRLASQGIWAYDAPATETGVGAGTGTDVDTGVGVGVGGGADVGGYRALAERTYTYRPDGYPTAITDTLRGDRAYELDPTGRITAVAGGTWNETYSYDRAGNPVEASWPGADEAAGARQYRGTIIRQAGRVTYEHDAQGRVVRTIRRTLSGQARQWTYAWDADDRLTRVTTPGGAVWEYSYDPLGRRIAKRRVDEHGGAAERIDFAWDGSHLVEQSRAGADGRTETLTWDWEPGTDRVAAQTRSLGALNAPQAEIDREFYAIVADRIGTPTELVDSGGRVVWQARTTVWGRSETGIGGSAGAGGGAGAGAVAVDGAAQACPLRFPGQYHDDETGLDYNYLRYYDPETARFLSPDPLGLFPSPDDYAYVSNPLLWFDPLGLAPHHAVVTVYDPQGAVRHRYGLVSGHTVAEEAALGFPNAMMATHTENRAMRMHGATPTVPIANDPYAGTHPVQAGDHIVIDGEKPPCPQCKGAMNRAVGQLGVNVTYNWAGNAWHATG